MRYIYKGHNKSNFQLKTIVYFSDESLSKFFMFYKLNNGYDFVLYYGVGVGQKHMKNRQRMCLTNSLLGNSQFMNHEI
jgi:hypothetical protein